MFAYLLCITCPLQAWVVEDHGDKIFSHLDIQLDEVTAADTRFKSGKGVFRMIGTEAAMRSNESK